MRNISLPGTSWEVPAIIAGMMRIDQMSDPDIQAMTEAAIDTGITFFDHAAIYGGDHLCERRWAEAMKFTPAQREELIIQTKAGIRSDPFVTFDFSVEEITTSVEASLKALRTDYIDVLLLHRPDPLWQPDQIAACFELLWRQGKVRHFGVSNFNPGQTALLAHHLDLPILFNQLQLSITECPMIAQPFVTNMMGPDQAINRGADLLEYHWLNGVTIQAWSPFQAGFFTGSFIGDRDNFGPLNDVLDRLADEYGVEPITIATAWILRHPAQMQVVLGTTKPTRIRAAAAAADIQLTHDQWYELFLAAGNQLP